MRCLMALLIVLFQCQLYVPVLSDRPCTSDPPSPLSNLTNLVQDLDLNPTHWNPSFCGDWRWDDAQSDICVRVYCDRTSKNPLAPTLVKPIIYEAIVSLSSKPTDASFTDQSWSANDPTGRPGFTLRIAEWEKRDGLLSNNDVELAMWSLERYWSGPPYEQSDFLIYHDGVGIIGGGSGRRPPRLILNAVNGVPIN